MEKSKLIEDALNPQAEKPQNAQAQVTPEQIQASEDFFKRLAPLAIAATAIGVVAYIVVQVVG